MAYTSTKKIESKNPGLLLWYILLASRPIHWVKNLSIFAALIFSGNLYSPSHFNTVLIAFVAFSLATSATYIFNDLLDVELDRLHPIKKSRPIASGHLSVPSATASILAYTAVSLSLSLNLSTLFFLTICGYLSLQAAYSLGLKKVPTIDILIIATGFIIRVYSGAFVIDAHLSVWFLLCVISTALFLAAGKRRAELGVLPEGKTRDSLTKYQRELLNSYVTMFGNAAWMSWALFTFFESPTTSTPLWLFLAELSQTTAISKLLMATIPVVIFGIMRYEALIFENKSEAPEKLLLTDKPLVAAALLWITMVIGILYGGIASLG